MSSREYKGKRVVIWPVYIDSRRTRGEGRKLPINQCVKAPKPEEIFKAAERAKLRPEIENKKYPKLWWEEKTRITVDKVESKLKTLRLIAKELLKLRGKVD